MKKYQLNYIHENQLGLKREMIIKYYAYDLEEIIDHPILADKPSISNIIYEGQDVTLFIIHHDFSFYKKLEKLAKEDYLTNKTQLV